MSTSKGKPKIEIEELEEDLTPRSQGGSSSTSESTYDRVEFEHPGMKTKRFESDGVRAPIWMMAHAVEPPKFEALTRNIETDVTIIGGGIAGLTCAYLLSDEGKTVTVIDEREVISGQSGRTTAHLMSWLDDHFYNLQKEHTLNGARIAAESHAAAIDLIERICDRESIECEFMRVPGYLFLDPKDTAETLAREFNAAVDCGLKVNMLDKSPYDSIALGPMIQCHNQGQFHPVKYLAGLARVLQKRGVQIFTHTRARHVEGGKPATVITDNGYIIYSNSIIVATCTPINQKVSMHAKMEPYRSYVVTFRIPKDSFPEALFWDTADPYHYVRMTPVDREDYLIVGGEDHKVAHIDNYEERVDALVKWTRERFHMAGDEVARWSGQIMEPVDSLGFAGRSPGDKKNVYIITGDSGNGMTHASLSAIILTDMIMGRSNAWAYLYDPSRRRTRKAFGYLSHLGDVGYQYKGWITSSDVGDIEDIKPGCGAVLRCGMKKYAVYRDNDGNTHSYSAVCTHLGGIVKWNDFEKSWDCPVHGSRFDRYGKAVTGPACKDLAALELPAKSSAKREAKKEREAADTTASQTQTPGSPSTSGATAEPSSTSGTTAPTVH